IILERYPTLKSVSSKYKYVSTIDIDNAYAYLEKGLMRTIGAYGRSLVNFDLPQIVERSKVLMRLMHDPYHTYELMHDLHKRYKINVIYFFLLGEYGENDKNVSVDNRNFQSLIQSLADYADAGIHPSYGSNIKDGRLQKEVQLLTKILKREVTKSRQHFLKIRLPDTYRKLISVDIKEDFTMGYAGNIGFRAGICSSFYFYDLDQEVQTPLLIHPFAVMDATFRYYLKVNPEQVIDLIKPLIEEVKAVNGTFISLWHNESLSENHIWKGYRDIYEELLKIAAV
ncbi:MAG TPA: polysaccharide deacetylase family protein, partial [Bacteroidia bacterium]|nr:polysaccharide deacetylase family protein [Bacteroidia bacterium]